MTSILDQTDDQLPIVPQVDPEKDYFAELVGEDKPYKTEKDLARAVAEKEAFIQRTTRENAELREDLKASRATKRLEEMLDQMQALQARQEPPSNDDNQRREPERQSPQLTLKEVEEFVSRRDREKSQRDNRDTVMRKLQSVYGENYVSKVKETASQLNADVEFLDSLAVNNPPAFFKLMGIEDKRQEDNSILSPPRGRTNTTAFTANKKNWPYFENMRKADPSRYHSIQTQNEMHQEALKQGEAFYET